MNKLAIDLSYQSGGGTLKHIQELINNIKYYEFDEIIFLVAKDNMEMLESITDSRIIVKKLFFSKKSIVVRTIWIQLILPLLIILYNIDVLFCAGNISPIIKLCKKVQWIHTIGPFEAQIINCYRFAIKIKLYISRYLIIKSASTSDTVIYESIYTKNIIEQNYNLNLNNSIVIHTGKDSYYYPYNAEYINIDGQQYNYEYIFTISHLYPYKNIELLIEAFYRLSLHEKGIKLLIAGAIMDKLYFEKLKSIVSGYGISNNIIFLGLVGKYDLRILLSLCKIFVFTSPYENFAYTLIEAMSCSAPMIVTNSTAMPETCGDAALYYSPYSVQELSDCILAYLNDENKRIMYKNTSLQKVREYDDFTLVNKKINNILKKLT